MPEDKNRPEEALNFDATVGEEANSTDNAPESPDMVELNHFMKAGKMNVGETTYAIKNGKVKVASEHAEQVRKHIEMGG